MRQSLGGIGTEVIDEIKTLTLEQRRDEVAVTQVSLDPRCTRWDVFDESA
jgi:hypothetical protein